MSEIREYDYPHKEDNPKLLELIKNTSGKYIPESNRERGDNCHITEDWIEDYFHKHSEVNNFVKWLEVTTEQKVENSGGVLYYDNGGIKWHSHHPNDDVSHSFVYYVNVPNNSSSTRFSKDPSKEGNDVDVPIIEGHCLVWDHNLPHCVPPSNHNGRCVISGNLK